MSRDATRAVEKAARESYGKLLAFLASRTRDLAACEDALASAFQSALETWPRDGAPDSPEAWLCRVARRKLIDLARRDATAAASVRELEALAEEGAPDSDPSLAKGLVDERAAMLFACAHPALDASIRTPLMLQTALGLSADEIASAFLTSPQAMAKRLSRAKAKIRAAGIPFATPDRDRLEERLDDALAAIYVAYSLGWDSSFAPEADARGLEDEAIFLAETVARALPSEPEPKGLWALMLFQRARARARRSADGSYVPLKDQDPAAWDASMIEVAEALMREAARCGRVGRYQIEAAIQSAHCARRIPGVDARADVVNLYRALLTRWPSIGACIGLCAALLEIGDARSALAQLDELDPESVARHQPFWATKARALEALGRIEDALSSYEIATGLSKDAAVRAHLGARRAELRRLRGP